MRVDQHLNRVPKARRPQIRSESKISGLTNRPFGPQHQRGGALVVAIMVLLCLVSAIIVIKAFPVIYDGKAIQDVFESLPTDPKIKKDPSKKNIVRIFNKKMQVNQIKYVKGKQIVFTPNKTGGLLVTLNYDVPIPLKVGKEEETNKVIDVFLKISFRNQVVIKGSTKK